MLGKLRKLLRRKPKEEAPQTKTAEPPRERGRVRNQKTADTAGSGGMKARGTPKGSISARVIRKDGTVEDLGVISKPRED